MEAVKQGSAVVGMKNATHAVVAAPASLALLPFKPRPGNRYTLSVRMHCTNANPVYEWMALAACRA